LFKATNGKTTNCLKQPMAKPPIVKNHQWQNQQLFKATNGKTLALENPPMGKRQVESLQWENSCFSSSGSHSFAD
jgi:hypothetical protein